MVDDVTMAAPQGQQDTGMAAKQAQASDPAQPTALAKLQQYLGMDNIADLGEELEQTADMTLAEIGALVKKEYDYDLLSREDWEKPNENGMMLAQQLKEGRKYAGETVADVKYPTIASAAIAYASRAYPAIVKDQEVVRYKVVGADPEGAKAARGIRVAQYMNCQILEKIDNWDEDMDKMLFMQPVIGTFFKKIYRDPIEKKDCVELVWPQDLVVYYNAPSFDKWPRKTQVIPVSHNEYLTNVRAGVWLDIDLTKPEGTEEDAGQHTFLEQHRLLDLDGDGYEEPYVVTVEEETSKVVRIVARFERGGVVADQQGQVVRITATEHYVEYPFMPSFDGGVYGMGFGILLGPLNDSINTLLNQLIDAGTRSSSQTGFVGKGVRLLRGGETGSMKFRRGEWKVVQSTGDNLRNNIVPLPLAEPSTVLFQLLGFLVSISKELASQSDLLAGQQDKQNVPATSTLALIEQGLKVFSGIYKRTYRALRKEFGKLHRLNALHLTQEEYAGVIDDPQGSIADFVERDYDIRPVSTPGFVTETQQYMLAQAMLPMRGAGLNDMEINMFYMESIGVPNVQRFLPKGPPPPQPQFIVAMRELDIKDKEADIKLGQARIEAAMTAAKVREMRMREVKLQADAMEAIAKAESLEPGSQLQFYQSKMTELLAILFEAEQVEKQQEAERQAAEAQAQAVAKMQQPGQPGQGQPGMPGPGQPPQPPATPQLQ